MDIKMTRVSKDSKAGLCIADDFQNSATAALRPVQQLEFKTSLLEVVEELRIRRAAENRYEEQISNLAVEKQELEWQKESLQHQYNALSSQHEEAMTVLKKQFQTRVTAVEEEKGKFQLTAESKEREISGLKEELKVLQVSKYSLEKKLNELEQKVQLQTVAKDNQLSQLSEVEKRFAAISRQCGLIKQAHEKLEQNVEEATRLNKKLIAVNKNQENAIHDLNQELEKVTADLIRSKVTSQCKLGEENIHLSARQQQLQELKLKLQMEVELNKRLSKNASAVQEEKQEVLKLFQHTQQLLQRQELALGRTEAELKVSGEKHQVLERDNERLREKAEENEDKFQNLQRENEKSTARWKKEETRLNEENQLIKSDLESFKEAHAKWQESHSKLPAHSVQQEQPMQIPQNNLKHFDQRTAQGTPGPQTSVTEALTATDNELKHAEIQNTTEEEIKEEPIERDYKKEGINNHSQDGMVNADNIDSPSPKRVNDTFNTSSVPLYPKRNSSEEWNAIAQTFYDFSRTPVQEKLCSSSTESFKIPYPPASMKHHGPFTESCSQPYFNPQSPRLSEVSTSNPMPKTTTEEFLFEDECDSQYFNIKGQINKIERFLSLDRFKSTRKRKADDSPDENAIKITLT
uniref:coiled-coil domain-containing protein 73 isoform X8 n=1 Tax=Pristiophorus japonicus TaxID=55135 RepID=UPI00398E8088